METVLMNNEPVSTITCNLIDTDTLALEFTFFCGLVSFFKKNNNKKLENT